MARIECKCAIRIQAFMLYMWLIVGIVACNGGRNRHDVLYEQLVSTDQHLSQAAVKALKDLLPGEEPRLVMQLQETVTPTKALLLLDILSDKRADCRPIIDQLLSSKRKRDIHVATAILIKRRECGTLNDQQYLVILALLKKENSIENGDLVQCLAASRSEEVKDYLVDCAQKLHGTRLAAFITALGHSGIGTWFQTVAGKVKDPDPIVRMAALMAATSIDSRRASSIARRLKSDEDERVRELADSIVGS